MVHQVHQEGLVVVLVQQDQEQEEMVMIHQLLHLKVIKVVIILDLILQIILHQAVVELELLVQMHQIQM
jgi:hypothetical protein